MGLVRHLDHRRADGDSRPRGEVVFAEVEIEVELVAGERPPVPPGAQPKWSALEYAAHVRDVYQLTAERLTKMIKKNAPTFQDWDQNTAAVEGNYANEDPDKVSYALAVNAGKVADLLDAA